MDRVVVRHDRRPARKLVVRRGIAAADYFAYCEEYGCDVYDELATIEARLGEPMGLWLPSAMRLPETSEYVMGVELPADANAPDAIEIPATDYLVFQGPPYEEAEMGSAIGAVLTFIEAFDPTSQGWRWSDDAPRFQLAPMGHRGYIEGRCVVPF